MCGDDRASYVAGKDASDFQLLPISEASGGRAESFQIAGRPMFLDNIGIRELSTTDAFGNWRIGAISERIEPLIRSYRRAGTMPAASARIRSRDQYRLYFGDKTGISIYLGRGAAECMPFELPYQPNVVASGQDASGNEIVFAGDADSGMVYEMDRGTSYDGAAIEAFVRLAFFNDGCPIWRSAGTAARSK